MKDLYNHIYKLSKKGARLQTKNLGKAEIYFKKIDQEIQSLINKGLFFNLICNKKKYNLPVKINEISHFRPFFKMATHKLIIEVEADDTHAVDFDVPLGTNVYSVSDGIVAAVSYDSIIGGNDISFAGKDNYLYIFNKVENIMFCYRHLEKFNNIALNSKIKKGELIGKVGLTGYVITPHLHFVIYKFDKNKKIKLKSLKIKFV